MCAQLSIQAVEPANGISHIQLIASTAQILLERAHWNGIPVWVKRVKPTLLSNIEILERFDREGDVLERLDHPNIPRLVHRDRGILMREYIEGNSLHHYLEHTNIDYASTLHIAKGVLSALVHSHVREILHLDVKPSNVLLSANRRVHLIDFGSAKDLTVESITQADVRLGTPHYMAPEQYQGIRDDQRSDVYSVGALLYECLMGKPLHKDPFAWLAGRGQLPTDLPNHQGLAKIILKAVQRNPEDRYAEALDMLEALEGLYF